MIAIRHAWLQKHPSPVAGAGEFHWYPAEGDRDVRASLVERMRGVEPPAVLWQLAPGRVVWATPFAAVAADTRRYVGLVLTIAEHAGTSAADLLDALAPPPAAPWSEDIEAMCALAVRYPRPAPQVTFSSLDIMLDSPALDEAGDTDRWASTADPAAVVRALLSGGAAAVGDPSHRQLPAWIASLERWLPESVVVRSRQGTWTAAAAPVKADRVAELAAAGWRDRTSPAAHGWRLLVELAEARAQSVDEVAALAEGDDAARGTLTDEECRELAGRTTLVEMLHAWGRGRLDRSATAATLPARLADAVALRALAQLADGCDPKRALAEARWYALLPAARRTMLLETVVQRAGSLRRIIEEVGHA